MAIMILLNYNVKLLKDGIIEKQIKISEFFVILSVLKVLNVSLLEKGEARQWKDYTFYSAFFWFLQPDFLLRKF